MDTVLSSDGLYRYRLERTWDSSKPKILFIMLNPSTADASHDDPTIRRIIRFARDWAYGGLLVGNLYAFRSTKPTVLKTVVDPIGPENIAHIEAMVKMCEKVVYAYGNNQKEPDWLKALVAEPYVIKRSKKGIPSHPLYLKADLVPTKFR
jgi:hypothetical protein